MSNGYHGTLEEWLADLRGAQGDASKDGTDGSVWYTGIGTPSSALGKTGDYYLDFGDGGVYEKEGSGWTRRGMMKSDGIVESVELTIDACGG